MYISLVGYWFIALPVGHALAQGILLPGLAPGRLWLLDGVDSWTEHCCRICGISFMAYQRQIPRPFEPKLALGAQPILL